MIWGVVDRVRVVAGSVGKDGLYMQSLFELKAVITFDKLTHGEPSAYIMWQCARQARMWAVRHLTMLLLLFPAVVMAGKSSMAISYIHSSTYQLGARPLSRKLGEVAR